MLIAVPSAIKTFNWLGTLWGVDSLHHADVFALGFVFLFTIGGLSGIFMASTPVDIFITTRITLWRISTMSWRALSSGFSPASISGSPRCSAA